MNIYERKLRIQNLHLNKKCNFAGAYDMPVLKAYDGSIPEVLIPFNVAIRSHDYMAGVHFFIDDYQFERIWAYPERYLGLLGKFGCVIAPDFSQYADMPSSLRIWQNYRGKAVGAWLQSEGVNVIPNVTWSKPDSFSYCFDGIPKESIIAINCQGIRSSALSMYFWELGYKEAIKRLNPTQILRYGDKMPDEREDVSIYYPNCYIKKLKEYGRERKSVERET